MLKMYHTEAHSGSTPDYWDDNWDSGNFENSVSYAAIDPLRPLFEEYLRPESLMLEGGCGLGNYVSYYTARGYRVIGLDFAQNALKKIHLRQPNLMVTGGNVAQLPFPDETFDLYYSGGVVEHFENGAEESLREARRVLKKDGILLISVPYFSPLRKTLLRLRSKEWRVVEDSKTDPGRVFEDKSFFQYAYTRKEFSQMLANAGLKVVKTQGFSVIWGLYDIPFLNPAGKSEPASSFADSKKAIEAIDAGPLIKDRKVSLIKRLVVSEDASIPVFGLGVSFFRWAAANMMMYVCTPAE